MVKDQVNLRRIKRELLLVNKNRASLPLLVLDCFEDNKTRIRLNKDGKDLSTLALSWNENEELSLRCRCPRCSLAAAGRIFTSVVSTCGVLARLRAVSGSAGSGAGALHRSARLLRTQQQGLGQQSVVVKANVFWHRQSLKTRE